MSLLDRNSEIEMRGHKTYFPDVLDIFCLSFQIPSVPFVIFPVTWTTVLTAGHHWDFCSLTLIGFNRLEEPGGNEKTKSKKESKAGVPTQDFSLLVAKNLYVPLPEVTSLVRWLFAFKLPSPTLWGHTLHLLLLVTGTKYFTTLTTTLEVAPVFNFHQLSCFMIFFFFFNFVEDLLLQLLQKTCDGFFLKK